MPPPSVSSEIYTVFSGQINQDAVQRILKGLAPATAPNARISGIHMLFHSFGGFVGDGVCLFNFFRSFPLPLTLYNSGTVMSAATVAYLGAKKRKTSARATFMIHRTRNAHQSATASALEGLTESIALDDARTESILREQVTLPPDKWTEFNYRDLHFSGEQAVQIGLAQELGEFDPPPGIQIFNF